MSETVIEYEYPEGMLKLGLTSPGEFVLPSLTDALTDLQTEVERAYQPQRLRDAYAVLPAQQGASGDVGAELVNEGGVLYPSFVYGSAPHFPYWADPDLVEWANVRGIPPFLVALAVSQKGTPPHEEIPQIIERHEELIARSMIEALDRYFEAVF